jgi:hypothetical protein
MMRVREAVKQYRRRRRVALLKRLVRWNIVVPDKPRL